MTAAVDLITGFLGAGKTTFLLRYGAWLEKKGVRFAVIENEFGAAGVDRAVLSEQFGNVGELSGGCVCCTLKAGLYAMLSELSETCERILVEPSGLFNMDDFYDILHALEQEGKCRAGMCLTMIDPHSLPGLQEQELEVLWTELVGTGAVVWTKADCLPKPDLNAAAREVQAILGLAEPLTFYPTASHLLEEQDFEVLQESCGPVFRPHSRRQMDHTQMFQSTSMLLKGGFDPETLTDVLDKLSSQRASGDILRIKGFVYSGSGSLSVNYAVTGRSVVPCDKMPPMLNFIGRNLNRAAIRSALEAVMLPLDTQGESQT